MKVVLLITAGLLLLGCNKENKNGCTPESFEYVFQNNQQIDTFTTTFSARDTFYGYRVVPGGNRVFRFTHTYQSCPDIADGGGGVTVVFEVAPGSDAFHLQDSADLAKAHALVYYSCFCPVSVPFIKSGVIDGKRITNDIWMITASLQGPWQKIEFAHRFLVSN